MCKRGVRARARFKLTQYWVFRLAHHAFHDRASVCRKKIVVAGDAWDAYGSLRDDAAKYTTTKRNVAFSVREGMADK